jgi:transcriptional regulator with XRE-family HTH domain
MPRRALTGDALLTRNRQQRTIGARFAAARGRAALTQDELALRADTAQAVISRIERGLRPPGAVGARIADVLGLDLDDLTTIRVPRPPCHRGWNTI